MSDPLRHSAYQALKIPNYRRYLIGHVLAVMGQGMMAVTVGWELYERTHSVFVLGGLGLAQVIPLIILVLPAGHIADSHDRRRVLGAAQVVITLSMVGLMVASHLHAPVWTYYGAVLGYGVGRSLQLPARQSLLPSLVPRSALQNAIAWNSGGWQAADVVGPALGGALIALTGGPLLGYGVGAATAVIFLVNVTFLPHPSVASLVVRAGRSWHDLLEGARFVRRTPVLLAAMSLDLFAVLLGGVVAILPVFAKDILEVGPSGLGWLRAAQSAGAVGTSVLIAHRPPLQRAGRSLLIAVTGFGIAIIVFGLSRSYLLSLSMLFVAGGFDAVSVVVRSSLTQLETPDELRGRVAAVNGLFIGMSNELGEFESGFLAGLIGPVAAVVSGGIAVILVVMAVRVVWPELRSLGRIGERTAA